MYLPSAPDAHEKYLYLKTDRLKLYTYGAASILLLTWGMILFCESHAWLWVFYPFVVFQNFYLTLSFGIGFLSRDFDLISHLRLLEKHRHIENQGVDVFLPICNEPIDVLKNTWTFVRGIKWNGQLDIYVLDDGNNPQVKDLAHEFGFHYIRRPNVGELKKAGNLRFVFQNYAKNPFFVVFDADFCPRSDFLSELMPYFLEFKNLGLVQTPQYFSVDKSKMTYLECAGSASQELFYRLVQTSRDKYGAAICCGSNAMYRREAFEPFGGTYPIGYSEDVYSGLQVQSNGWLLKYVPINLAKGLCPDNKKGYFSQQYRWAMGSISLLFSKFFWQSKLKLSQRLCLMSGQLYYIASALSIFLIPLPSLIVLWFLPEKINWLNWMFVLPSYVFGSLVQALWMQAPWGYYCNTARVIGSFSHLRALIDHFRKDLMPWIPTGAVSNANDSRFKWFKRFNLYWAFICFLLMAMGIAKHMEGFDVNFLPLIAFAILHLVDSLIVDDVN